MNMNSTIDSLISSMMMIISYFTVYDSVAIKTFFLFSMTPNSY